jgi:hypothetical protein
MRQSAPFPVLFFASAAHGMNHVLIALYLTLVLVIAQDWHLPYNDLILLWVPGAMLIGLRAKSLSVMKAALNDFEALAGATLSSDAINEPVSLGDAAGPIARELAA